MHEPTRRSLAIDVMRGLTVAFMILVNMSLSEQWSYGALLHARWHGLTPTDLVFPTFLFVVGASLAFTLDRLAALGHGPALAKILRRAALLFLAGFLMSWYPFFQLGADGHWALRPWSHARILGVLQRIALCYMIAALLLLWGGRTAAWIYGIVALLGSWLVMTWFGDLSLAGNAALRLDLWAMGADHLYRGEGIPYDPEGLLGTWPSVVNVLAGYGAMRWLRSRDLSVATVGRLAGFGVLCLGLALVWNQVLPINKKLWTSSYVLITIGFDLLLLALLTEMIDRRGWRRGAWIFAVFGLNPLFIYLFSELVMATMWLVPVDGMPIMEWIYHQIFQGWIADKNGSLLYAVVFTSLCWLVGWVLYTRRIVIRL